MEKTRLEPKCPIRTTMELIGGKWRLLIINHIGKEELRYGELKKAIPDISEKMLAQELKNLVDGNLVLRINYNEVPPKVGYRLTKIGEKVLPLIAEFARFGERYAEEQRKRWS